MEIGEYREYSINNDSEVFVRNVFDEVSNSRLYMLVLKSCIEIRTEEQHRILLETLRRRANSTNSDEDKNRYKCVMYYSKPLNLVGSIKITLGRELVECRQLGAMVIIEKCSNCARIWHPKMFEYMKNTSRDGRTRR